MMMCGGVGVVKFFMYIFAVFSVRSASRAETITAVFRSSRRS